MLEGEISIYPNPAKDRFTITFNRDAAAIKDVALFDAQGKIYAIRPVMVPSLNAMEIDITDLSRGLYLIKINNGTKDEFFRLIKE
jgi:hypothetical protein